MKKMIPSTKMATVIFCVVASLLLWLAPAAQSAEGTAVIAIKAASPPHPVVHRLTKDAYQLFGDEVERRTNGKVKFTWFFGDSLVKMPQSYESVQSGVVDLVVVAAFLYPHIFKITEGLSLPFTVQGAAHSADIAWKMYQTMPEMQQEMKDIKFLGVFTTDVINLSTKDKLVKTLDDMKNLRVAVGSGLVAQMAQLLGMAPQPVGYSDVYMAIHRGMAEATLFPNAPLRSYKITEITNAHTIANFKVEPMVIAMRKETWDKLPPDVQKVFDELMPSFARLCGHTLTNEGAWVLEALSKRGDKFYAPPGDEFKKWKDAVKPMYDVWIKKLNDSGMNGQAIFDRINEIAAETKVADTPEDEWWKQGRIGKKTEK
ncbi:TRAP transporter substrate-binding protein DctP [Desulfomonile tiedjei]|uniref:TRAP-type C4-dicarboxylate transport system, periplasmic component n=1 Tax=Desulfomonile tiedjei (strain ATCC 49306 / DSM 6799 / DCB-1) TaxID=706587 RepID=I4CDU9_DESTA|nr:TRAP transporter substrate-binding protein DctP [Desulfomonile tiedjei]AFM27740.1 TRAP-type C4-dicarboxylate transport system, periplasmic component [Desulfomonile tiedjei DSM 6799]